MTYPPYPAQGGYPVMPAHHGYAEGESPASGGTAITAGVLACLGGLFAVWSAVDAFGMAAAPASAFTAEMSTGEQQVEAAVPDWLVAAGIIGGIVHLAVVGLLIGGGILLFLRKSAGRWMVVAGCALVIVSMIATAVMMNSAFSSMLEDLEPAPGATTTETQVHQGGEAAVSFAMGLVVVVMLIFSIPALATGILALVPPTGRWCAQRSKQLQAQAPPPPPYGGYTQAAPQPYGYGPMGPLPPGTPGTGFGQPPQGPPNQPGRPPQ